MAGAPLSGGGPSPRSTDAAPRRTRTPRSHPALSAGRHDGRGDDGLDGPASGDRGVVAAIVGAAAIALASFLVVEVYDLDVWWHLAIGREILSARSVPTFDRWTVLGNGRPYHDSHWLFQAVLAAFHRSAGWVGVQALVVGLWGATFAALWRLARRHVAPAAAALLVSLAGLASAERFLPRPELVTYACLAWFLVWLEEPALGRPTRLASLGAIQAVWTNAHGLFPLGPAAVLCHVTIAAARRRSRGAENLRDGLLALGVTLAASLVAPFGFHGWRYSALLLTEAGQGAGELIGSLGEMTSPFAAVARRSPAMWAFFLLLALGLAAGWRLLRREGVDAALLVAAGCAILAVTGRRNVVLLAVAAVPVLARGAARLPEVSRAVRKRCGMASAALLLGFAAFPLSGAYYLWMEIPARFGVGVSPSFFPHGSAGLLASFAPGSGLLASNTLGGFVSFHGAPRLLPLTDGRWEIQDEATLARVLEAIRSPGRWRDAIREFQLKGILLAHTSPEARAVLPEIAADPSWRLVYLDAAASLWLPSGHTSLPPVPLERLPVRALIRRPEDGLLLASFASAARAPRLEEAALESTLEFGIREAFVMERLGTVRIATGRFDEAEAAFKRLLQIAPRNEAALNELAFLAFRRGDRAEAIRLLRRGVAIAPANPELRRNLEVLETK